jgi:hypothetical protein
MVDEISDKVRIAIETWDNLVDKFNEYSDEAHDKRRRGRNQKGKGMMQSTSKPLEKGCCTICGKQFVYKRRGTRRLTCSAECSERRYKIWNRAYDKKRRASAEYKAKKAAYERTAKYRAIANAAARERSRYARIGKEIAKANPAITALLGATPTAADGHPQGTKPREP